MTISIELMGLLITLAGVLLTVIGQALYVAYKLGKLEEKLTNLEKKQDKHNNLIERMAKAEASINTAHSRIDFIEGK